MEKYVSVIGGINLDLKGFPTVDLRPATSNPGQVYISAGGVGRNIAHNLALLGTPVYLFGAVGNDEFGSRMLSETKVAGVNVTYLRVLPDQPTGMYLSILTPARDLAVAISAMDITRTVDRPYLESCREVLRRSSFIVVDTNVAETAFEYVLELCRQEQIPCLVEPVSVAKAQKFLATPTVCDYLTPNRAELEALTQQSCEQLEQLPEVCAKLRSKCRHLLVKLDAAGVYHYACEEQVGKWYPPFQTEVVEPNGAGDAFAAGFICGVHRGLTTAAAIQLGMAAAYLTLQSPETVSPRLSFETCAGLLTI